MRTKRELNELLADHIYWLYASAQGFDEGRESESKRIAVVIRTLVHDTPASTSLLSQLGMRDQMAWLSAVPLDDSGFIAPPWVDDVHEPGFRPRRSSLDVSTTFATWWEGAFPSSEGSTISRCWLVLQTANFDGGAHVDPDLPIEYRSISREGGLRPLRINSAGDTYPDRSNPIPSALRTICTEVIASIEAAW